MFCNNRGKIDDYEKIFDIYTKLYDFLDTDVKVITQQDLWKFYNSHHKDAEKKKVNIYKLVLFFIEHHPNGHYIVDECPIYQEYGKNNYYNEYANPISIKF